MPLPLDFIEQIKKDYNSQAEAIISSIDENPVTSVRFNPEKQTKTFDFDPVPWCSTAYFLKERPSFTLDPFLHAGGYYVQESSSMFIEHIIKQLGLNEIPQNALDLCAAPGGKTSLLQANLHRDSVVVANEIIKSRSNILSENLQKWGFPNVIVTNNDSSAFAQQSFQFDLIVVDAPCSGEGMFRKDHAARDEWSLDNVKVCAERQKEILSNIWGSLKPGGYLIYSTCTFNTAENEEAILSVLDECDAECIKLDCGSFDEIDVSETDGAFVYRFLPHKVKGEGFAVSVLKKGGEAVAEAKSVKKKKHQKKQILSDDEIAICNELLIENDGEYIFNYKDEIVFLSQKLAPVYDKLKNMRIVSAGVALGSFKKKKFVPLASLAYSLVLKRDFFPSVEVDLAVALQYLKKESLRLSDAPKGWLLLTFEGVPLGLVNNLGNRANNPYVAEWKIRMNLPSELPLPFWSGK